MKDTSAGPAKTFWFNGEEQATLNFDTSSKTASHTMPLPSGKDLTIDLALPKMTADASDLEFGVTITPDRKVVTKFGWEWAGVKKATWMLLATTPGSETTSCPGRESSRRSLAPSTRSSGPAMVRPPRASSAGSLLLRPTWSPVSTPGT